MGTQKETDSRRTILMRESTMPSRAGQTADRATQALKGSEIARRLPARFLDGTAWDEV